MQKPHTQQINSPTKRAILSIVSFLLISTLYQMSDTMFPSVISEVTSENKVQEIPKEMVIELSQISDPFWLSLFPL